MKSSRKVFIVCGEGSVVEKMPDLRASLLNGRSPLSIPNFLATRQLLLRIEGRRTV